MIIRIGLNDLCVTVLMGLICKPNYLDVTQLSQISLVWNQLIISSCFEACGVQRFHLQKVCARDWLCILPRMNKIYGIVTYEKTFQCFHVMLHWVTSYNPLSTLTHVLYVWCVNTCVHCVLNFNLLVAYFKVFLWILGSARNRTSELPSHAWAQENDAKISLTFETMTCIYVKT